MLRKNNNQENTANNLSPAEIYDRHAPAVYGKILSIVHSPAIADKISQQVFISAFKDKSTFIHSLRPPLITLLNHSRDKSYKTIKALNIFRECCAGASISINETK